MKNRREVLGLLGRGATAVALTGARAARAGEKDADAALEAAGGKLRRDREGRVTGITFPQSETLTDAEFARLGQLPALKQLTFYGKSLMTDEQAAVIGRLPALEELAANGTRLTDPGFKNLAGLKTLRRLTFWHLGWNVPKEQRVTGAGFSALADLPNLEQFNFSGSTVTDEGLAAVGRFRQVKSLVLYHTWTTDAGLARLSGMAQLRSIDVGPQFSMRIGDPGVAVLAALPALEELKVQETLLTYDGSLERLKALKHLKSVTLEKVEISDADAEKLKADLPGARLTWNRPSAAEIERMRKELARRAGK